MEKTINYLEDELKNGAVVFEPGQGDLIDLDGGRITLKITSDMTNDQLGVYEIVLSPGTIGARMHYHRFTNETFIVTEGTLTIQLVTGEVNVPQGGVAYVPRFTPHGFSNNSDEKVKLMLLFNPGQSREGFFLGMKDILNEVPVDPAKFLKLYNKYDSFPVDTANMLPSKKAE